MIDIDFLRTHAHLYRQAILAKGVPLDLDRLLAVDTERRQVDAAVNRLRAERNRMTDLVAAERTGIQTGKAELIAQSRAIGKELVIAEARLNELNLEFHQLAALLPGLPSDDVPLGKTDQDNVEIRKWGDVPNVDFQRRDHLELAALHRLLDLEGARNAAGSRAYALVGQGALLELAVLRFALDRLVTAGFTAVLPPLMVRQQAMFGTGYFPLGEDNAYTLEKDNLFLTGTSEVGIVAMHMNRTIEADQLPMRYIGTSVCFRREAGAAGRDTKGLYRVHQFQKVEQVVFCQNDPKISQEEHYKLLQNAEDIVQALELPYRVVAVCTGDLGLGQVRKHDIETWMPSRNAYGETHSCSTFHDFQARRLNIRYKDGKQKQFIHTLNNTAIASPRILIPLLENHQQADGSIYVPKALRPYLGGGELLAPST